MSLRLRSGMMILFLLGVACEPPPEHAFRHLGMPIINGAPDTNPDHQAVAALFMSTGGQYGYLCTGTVIAPRVVLTAAHCVDEFGPSDITVYFGPSIPGTVRHVSETWVHPEFYASQTDIYNDVALVRLSSSEPSGVVPIPHLPYAQRITSSDIGDPLEFVGYGETESGSDGTKLTVTNDLEWICESTGGCWWPNPGSWNTICTDMSPGGTCQGDSGGPAFILRSGQEYVAGITSYGDPGCDDHACSTKVDEFEADINAFISGADGAYCDNDAECDSGFCRQGVCCASDCAGTCVGCNVPGAFGICRTVPTGWDCSDGDPCNGVESCQGGACVATGGPACDDQNPCTTDTCSPATGCQHSPVPNGTSCADEWVCDGDEVCQAGGCRDGTPLTCEDHNPCTNDSCHPTAGCQHTGVVNGTACFDDDVCNGAETCQGGTCIAGTAIACDDGNPCTNDNCDRVTGCFHQNYPDNMVCDDGNACTGDGRCQAGVCTTGPTVDCNDRNPCTQDTCAPASGCQHSAVVDGTPCGGGQCGQANCVAGQCVSGDPASCDDQDLCTRDWCDPETGCVHEALPDGYGCGDCLMCLERSCVEVPDCRGSGGCGTTGAPASPVPLLWLLWFGFPRGRRNTQ